MNHRLNTGAEDPDRSGAEAELDGAPPDLKALPEATAIVEDVVRDRATAAALRRYLERDSGREPGDG